MSRPRFPGSALRLEQDPPGPIELAFLVAIVGSILLLAAWVLGWHLPI